MQQLVRALGVSPIRHFLHAEPVSGPSSSIGGRSLLDNLQLVWWSPQDPSSWESPSPNPAKSTGQENDLQGQNNQFESRTCDLLTLTLGLEKKIDFFFFLEQL